MPPARPPVLRLAPAALLSLALAASATTATAQEVVYLIRHAEKDSEGADPVLTEAGRARAAGWARMLAEAGIDAILTSDRRRTQETGAIVGAALGLPQVALPASDVAATLDRLQFEHAEDVVLVVGHSETLPLIVEGLGGGAGVKIGPEEFDTLLVLTGLAEGAPRLLHLRMP